MNYGDKNILLLWVDLIFSLPYFSTARYNQVLCFKFDLKDRFEEVIGSQFPIFIFHTNLTYSPFIRIPNESTWKDVYPERKMLDYLKEKYFSFYLTNFSFCFF